MDVCRGGVAGRSTLTGAKRDSDVDDRSVSGPGECGSGSGEVRSLGKGGKKSGTCGGGFQFSVRGRFRAGDEGLDIGDNGNGGVDGGRDGSSAGG